MPVRAFSACGLLGGAGASGGDRVCARLGHVLEHRLLESHVALDGVDEVRDQVPAALELDFDLRVCLADAQPALNEAVVDQDARRRSRQR